ncbi:MAG TPA: hypothetical protein DCE23_04255 [Firmicutes bacterium]|nr:hypothetical protein [Bacillota bacterium]
MFFGNKTKNNMYKILKSLSKTHDFKKTEKLLSNKISKDDYNSTIIECVEYQYLKNVDYYINVLGTYVINFPSKVFITCLGYDFLKNYFSSIFKLLRDLLLIIVTALITVHINNWFSTEPTQSPSCNCYSDGNTN